MAKKKSKEKFVCPGLLHILELHLYIHLQVKYWHSKRFLLYALCHPLEEFSVFTIEFKRDLIEMLTSVCPSHPRPQNHQRKTSSHTEYCNPGQYSTCIYKPMEYHSKKDHRIEP